MCTFDHSIPKTQKWCIYNLNLYKTIPNTHFLQSSFDSPIFPIQFRQSNFYTPVLQSNYYKSSYASPIFLQVNYGNPDSTFEYLKFSFRQSSFDINILSPHKYSQIAQLCRIKGCSGAGFPPPPIIFERLKLPQQIMYHRKGNVSESPNQFRYRKKYFDFAIL